MLPISTLEQKAHDDFKALEAVAQDHRRSLGDRLPHWNASEEEKAAHKALHDQHRQEIDRITSEMEALAATEPFLLYALKSELNAAIEARLPGQSPTALLTIAEQMVDALDGEAPQRTLAVIKNLILRFYAATSDPDIAAARATSNRVRYDALVKAGFGEDLAGRIIVAEASRPIPTYFNGSK